MANMATTEHIRHRPVGTGPMDLTDPTVEKLYKTVLETLLETVLERKEKILNQKMVNRVEILKKLGQYGLVTTSVS